MRTILMLLALLVSFNTQAFYPDDVGQVFCDMVDGKWLPGQCHGTTKVIVFNWGYDLRQCLGDALIIKGLKDDDRDIACVLIVRNADEKKYTEAYIYLFEERGVSVLMQTITHDHGERELDPGILTWNEYNADSQILTK